MQMIKLEGFFLVCSAVRRPAFDVFTPRSGADEQEQFKGESYDK
jgi:hypothetical protein